MEPAWAPTIRYLLLNEPKATVKQALEQLKTANLAAGVRQQELQEFMDTLSNHQPDESQAGPAAGARARAPPPAWGDSRGEVPADLIGTTDPSEADWVLNLTKNASKWYCLLPLAKFEPADHHRR